MAGFCMSLASRVPILFSIVPIVLSLSAWWEIITHAASLVLKTICTLNLNSKLLFS